MTSVATTWSPNSFQLRLASRCRKSQFVLVRTRVQRLDRRLRVFFVAGDARKNGNGEEQRRQGTSWGNSDSSVNALSGWSGNDSSDNSGNPQLKRWFEGMNVSFVILH